MEYTINSQQHPPSDLKPRGRGRALWRAVLTELQLDAHEVALLHEACRVLDVLDELDRVTRLVGVVLKDGRVSPWIIESRQQQLTLARLLATLRLPDDLALPEPRPQRRGGARGAYQLGARGGNDEVETDVD